MWVLECDGDILNNKRVWLRPGKTYLFGRTKPETSQYQTGFRINHKTVSRKHLTIAVASSGPNDVGQISKRSELTFEDAGTKAGTKVDGERINAGGKAVYSGLKHSFTLSSYEHAFHVTWKPVVMSFTFSSKDSKDGKDPLQPIHARLSGLDVRAIASYANTKTTHVIATKRNTARGLQALIQGAYIVNESFVDAIVAATTPADLDVSESFAPLEEDFDGAWPSGTSFLPAPGREPGPKDPELFEPDTARSEIFKGMTFIFCDVRQFESLQPPITDGGGKALLVGIDPEKTTAAELKRYIKDAAGEKDDGQLSDGNRIVVVKFGAVKGYEEWANQLQHDVAVAIGFRLVEQNEFLGAILLKDPGILIKRIEGDYVVEPQAPASTSELTADSSGRVSETQDSQSENKIVLPRRRRGKISSVFKGFDDGFDPNDIQPYRATSTHDSDDQSAALGRSMRSDLGASQNSSFYASSAHAQRPRGAGRKRTLPDSDDDIQEIEAAMFPGAAVMKRRKLEAERNGEVTKRQASQSRSTTVPASDAENEKMTKIKAEIDINAAIRAQRQQWDTKAEADEEGHMVGVEDMTVSQMKSLAVVEQMDVTSRQPLAESTGHRENGRWNEEWNGRPNFKKFRRQGEGRVAVRGQAQSVIVPLEEIKRKESGIGQGYWRDSRNKASSRYRQRIRATWEDEVEGSEEERRPQLPRSRTQGSKTSRITESESQMPEEDGGDAEPVQGDVADDGDPEAIDVDAAHTFRSNGGTTTTTTQTSVSRASRPPPTVKRTATQSSLERVVPKRQKTLDESMARGGSRADSDDDEEEDDLKFTFKKRK